jgi:hypothetical protein
VDGVDGIAPDVGADFSERLTDQRSTNMADRSRCMREAGPERT